MNPIAVTIGCAAVIIVLQVAQLRTLRSIHMEEKDLQAALDAVKDAVGRVVTVQQQQLATIASLRQQLADGQPVTHEQLDALAAEAQGIVDTLNQIAPADTSSGGTAAATT